MDVAIRPVAAADHKAVIRLPTRLMVGVDPSRPIGLVRPAVEDWVAESSAGTDGAAGLVAEHDDSIIGLVSVSAEDHWCGEKDARIGELMVDEAFEDNGVATSLIARVEEWATQRGLGNIRLTTGAANLAARAFYERLGYGPTEVTLTRVLPSGPATRASAADEPGVPNA